VKLGRYEGFQVLQDSVDRSPTAVVPNYNLACVLARLGDQEQTRIRKEARYREAIETLAKLKGLIGSDMRTIDKWRTDDDLRGLREDPALGRVLAETINELQAAG
jgi:hypothetical protein